jgi:twinfilin-like protein
MSHQTGIKSNENLRQFFAKSKEGNIRMLKVVINDNEELELDKYENVKSADWKADYNDFVVSSIEPKMPCFIFYRMDERTNSGFSWLFVSWSPDFASVKQKMLYAATKSTLKLEFGAGQIKDELFGTVRDDVTLDGYLRHIKSQLAPAPLTNREEELEILKQNENHTRINVDTKHKTLQGVMFPFEQKALESLDAFKMGNFNYLKLEIDIKNERILIDNSLKELSVDELADQMPVDKGRFHLYRFKHSFNEEKFQSILFIYSMPGFQCSVKERMIYSSTKSEIIQFLKTEIGLDIAKTFEISEKGEISEQYLLDELHPKKLNDGLKFEKPKGPSSRGPRRVTKQNDQV